MSSTPDVTEALSVACADLVKAIKRSDQRTTLEIISKFTSMKITGNRFRNEAKQLCETVTRNNVTPLHLAAAQPNKEVMRAMLSTKANVDLALSGYDDVRATIQSTPLMTAVRNNHADIAKMLLEYGANINQTNTTGWSALALASWYGFDSVIKVLLHRASPQANEVNLGHSLLVASSSGQVGSLRLLLEKGAKVGYQDRKHGMNSLMAAAQHNHTDIMKLLLEKGINKDCQDLSGWTALIHATHRGHRAAVELLLQHNVNHTLKTHRGQTAEDFATKPEIKDKLHEKFHDQTTEKIFEMVSTKVGHDWKYLFRRLMFHARPTLPPSAVDRMIKGIEQKVRSRPQQVMQCMQTWIQNEVERVNALEPLKMALKECQRDDIAKEIDRIRFNRKV